RPIVRRGSGHMIDLAPSTPQLPPDAAARDAAKREGIVSDPVLSDDACTFVTRGVSDLEKAAVIAVLSQLRAEETQRVRRVERRKHEPWARSQRVPQRIT